VLIESSHFCLTSFLYITSVHVGGHKRPHFLLNSLECSVARVMKALPGAKALALVPCLEKNQTMNFQPVEHRHPVLIRDFSRVIENYSPLQ